MFEAKTTYRVTWQIDIDADSPEEAAARALIVQRDAESTALVFEVSIDGDDPVRVDLFDRETMF